MKPTFLSLSLSILILFSFSNNSLAVVPSTFEAVYQLFQTNCTNSGCHSSVFPANGLDLQQPLADVYADLIDKQPINFAAKNKGYSLIEPGTPRRSFLFKKINNGLEPHFDLETNEGDPMPAGSNLTDPEIELVRQWILWGAPDTGMVVDTQVINEYYSSVESHPFVNVPTPPNASEAFFVHAGPYFLRPGDEIEYSQLHAIKNPNAADVYRVDTRVNDESHHTAMYKFHPGKDTIFERGFRIMNGVADAAAVFYNANVITQFPNDRDLMLPPGSAFKWEANTVLDLNYHLLNYNNTGILPCEIWISFYYDSAGTAQYAMESAPIYYGGQNITALVIPPNTDSIYTMDQYVPNAVDSIWSIWSMMAHTHQLGTSFNVWKRNANGTKGDQVYYGSYDETHSFDTGVYDWEHPPAAEYLPLLEIDMSEGLIHEAGFNNTTNNIVGFGLTTEDEMYVTYIHYINGKYNNPNSIDEVGKAQQLVDVFPNPVSDVVQFSINQNLDYKNATVKVYDMLGKQIISANISGQHRLSINVKNLQNGMYFFELTEKNQLLSTGKFMVAK